MTPRKQTLNMLYRQFTLFYEADSVSIMKDPKNILITGASSGIGAGLANHYAAPGISLALSGRNAERLKQIADQCRSKGAEVETALVDVTNQEAMSQWIKGLAEGAPLDLVFANAGISGGTGGVMDGEPVDQARQIFDVNLGGVLNTIGPALEAMKPRKCGQIAIISSLAGFRGWPSAPAYSASKGAVRFYGEAMRGALRKAGIQVNVICPGFVTSRITDANDFHMPMKMSAEKAARIIAAGLAKDKGRICFPWPTFFVSWFISVLPDCIAQKILARAPAKGAIKKS